MSGPEEFSYIYPIAQPRHWNLRRESYRYDRTSSDMRDERRLLVNEKVVNCVARPVRCLVPPRGLVEKLGQVIIGFFLHFVDDAA